MKLQISDIIKWSCRWKLEKYHDDLNHPYEVIEGEGNLLTYGGASILWQALIGAAPTYFSNANAHIGVGDSSTGAAATQTDLQAATNKLRKAMDATYPTHTDGTGASSNAEIVFKSTFGSTEANFAWNEWAIFNASSSGRMLNRKAESFGTKSAGSTWTLTITLSLA